MNLARHNRNFPILEGIERDGAKHLAAETFLQETVLSNSPFVICRCESVKTWFHSDFDSASKRFSDFDSSYETFSKKIESKIFLRESKYLPNGNKKKT
jgi:hypothetical protein